MKKRIIFKHLFTWKYKDEFGKKHSTDDSWTENRRDFIKLISYKKDKAKGLIDSYQMHFIFESKYEMFRDSLDSLIIPQKIKSYMMAFCKWYKTHY